jgi:hypothetical protein
MKNKNFNPYRLRSYLIVFGLLIASFAMVFGSLMFRSKLHPDYPLVFSDANNRLMVITKSNNSKNDIASITNANISYANNDTRYLLYTNNNNLYLLDTSVSGVGTKIAQNPVEYGFSKDDKLIYFIDNNNDLFIYERNESKTTKIASNVKEVEVVDNNNMIYNQNDNLIYQEIDSTPVLVSNTYETVELNKDNKLILYSISNNDVKDYYLYDINSNTSNKVLEGVVKLYDKDSNYTRFIYTTKTTSVKDFSNGVSDEHKNADKNFVAYSYEDYTSRKINKETYEANQKEEKNIDFRNQVRALIKEAGNVGNDLYYKNNNTTTLIESNINDLYYYNIRTLTFSYTAYSYDNNTLNIDNYTDIETFKNDFDNAKLNSMYYKYNTNEASQTFKNITSKAKIYIRNNNEYYLLVENNDYYDLYYSKITNRTAKLVGEIDSNLLTNKLIEDYAGGYLFANYINNRYYLNQVSEGRTRTLVEDVNPDYVVVSENKESIYYLKLTGDYTNDLVIYNGFRHSTQASDIYSLMYINNDLIYVTKNYDAITKTSDLYRLDGTKLTLIYKDIADWYSPLKEIEE